MGHASKPGDYYSSSSERQSDKLIDKTHMKDSKRRIIRSQYPNLDPVVVPKSSSGADIAAEKKLYLSHLEMRFGMSNMDHLFREVGKKQCKNNEKFKNTSTGLHIISLKVTFAKSKCPAY